MKRAILVLCALLIPTLAQADTGFQFAEPNMNVPDVETVDGMRLSFLWGKNERVSGLDLGLLSISETRDRSGLALIMGVSRVTGKPNGGANFSLINYHSGTDRGMNAGFINLLNDAEGAFNLGFVTIAQGNTLADVGGLNISNSSTAQIGFINITKEIKSFQFGFFNMAENGFFPFFPFVNFPKQ